MRSCPQGCQTPTKIKLCVWFDAHAQSVHLVDYSMSVFSTSRHGPFIFVGTEVKYETKIDVMKHAALITGNSQKISSIRSYSYQKSPASYLQTTLNCFVPMYLRDYC